MSESSSKVESAEQQNKNRVLDLASISVQDDSDLLEEEEKGPRKKRRRAIFLVVLVIILVAGGAGGGFWYWQSTRGVQATYQYQTVTKGTFTMTASATGAIQADTYNANFSDSGKISEIDVQLYDQVKKGQTLAVLTKPDGSTVTLTSPHDGVVTVINGKVGDPVNGGAVSGGNTFEITDLTALHIQANVNEADINQVAAGDSVAFTVSAYTTQTFTGKLHSVSPIGKSDSGVVTYPVMIDVDGNSLNGARLLPGMTAEVTITTISHSNTLLVPAKAITFARQAVLQDLVTFQQVNAATASAQQMLAQLKAAGKIPSTEHYSAAFVLEGSEGHWSLVPVVLGRTDGSIYEVITGSAKAGDRVAVGVQNGTSSQAPGAPSGGPPSGAPGGGAPGGGGLGL